MIEPKIIQPCSHANLLIADEQTATHWRYVVRCADCGAVLSEHCTPGEQR